MIQQDELPEKYLGLQIDTIGLYETPLANDPGIIMKIGATLTGNKLKHEFLLLTTKKTKEIPQLFISVDFYAADP
jgi:hypothetical protein